MTASTTPTPATVRITVVPSGTVITASKGARLLDILRDAGAPISYSCEAGRCGTCRCDLLLGDVLEDKTYEFRGAAVPSATRQILACRSQVVADCTISLVEPDEVVSHPAQILRCRVEGVHELNASTLALCLRPNRPLRFSAGQFAKLDFGSGLVRPYSMANEENADTLEFHLRRVPGGRVTTFVAEQVRAGHIVKLVAPLGTSYLRRKHVGPVLCIAGGTGLAPIRSIVRTALSVASHGVINLYVGARDERELYAIEELRVLESQNPLRLRMVTAVDAPPRDRSVRHGLITDVVASDLTSLTGWKVYLAGPPPMVEAGIRLSLQLGVRAGDIHADAFYPSEN